MQSSADILGGISKLTLSASQSVNDSGVADITMPNNPPFTVHAEGGEHLDDLPWRSLRAMRL